MQRLILKKIAKSRPEHYFDGARLNGIQNTLAKCASEGHAEHNPSNTVYTVRLNGKVVYPNNQNQSLAHILRQLNQPRLIIDYLVQQTRFYSASEENTKESAKTKGKLINVYNREYDIVETSHGTVIFIEGFYIDSYKDNNDQIFVPEKDRPIASVNTTSIIASSGSHIEHKFLLDKIVLLDSLGENLFDNDDGMIIKKYYHSLRYHEKERRNDVNLLIVARKVDSIEDAYTPEQIINIIYDLTQFGNMQDINWLLLRSTIKNLEKKISEDDKTSDLAEEYQALKKLKAKVARLTYRQKLNWLKRLVNRHQLAAGLIAATFMLFVTGIILTALILSGGSAAALITGGATALIVAVGETVGYAAIASGYVIASGLLLAIASPILGKIIDKIVSWWLGLGKNNDPDNYDPDRDYDLYEGDSSFEELSGSSSDVDLDETPDKNLKNKPDEETVKKSQHDLILIRNTSSFQERSIFKKPLTEEKIKNIKNIVDYLADEPDFFNNLLEVGNMHTDEDARKLYGAIRRSFNRRENDLPEFSKFFAEIILKRDNRPTIRKTDPIYNLIERNSKLYNCLNEFINTRPDNALKKKM